MDLCYVSVLPFQSGLCLKSREASDPLCSFSESLTQTAKNAVAEWDSCWL